MNSKKNCIPDTSNQGRNTWKIHYLTPCILLLPTNMLFAQVVNDNMVSWSTLWLDSAAVYSSTDNATAEGNTLIKRWQINMSSIIMTNGLHSRWMFGGGIISTFPRKNARAIKESRLSSLKEIHAKLRRIRFFIAFLRSLNMMCISNSKKCPLSCNHWRFPGWFFQL